MYNKYDQEYINLVSKILDTGNFRGDRTGTGTQSLFGEQMRFNMFNGGFPLLTTKQIYWKAVVHELLWFLKGDTNVKYLQDNGIKIWDNWIRPYTLDRPLVWVDQISFEPVSYDGTFESDVTRELSPIEVKLIDTWRGMMLRCYRDTHSKYDYYGGLGVTVCKEWHSAQKFIDDVQKLPHWHYKVQNWNSFNLDKDYYGSNQYNPASCVWLSEQENIDYCKSTTPVKATTKDGVEITAISQMELCNKINITKSSLSRFINDGPPKVYRKNNTNFIGWVFENYTNGEKLLRRELIADGDLGPVYGAQWRNFDESGVDQIKNVIERIKSKPEDRRLIVSAWNPKQVDSMALPPCHCFFQFYVDGDRLNMQMYQRSADLFLGVPFNIASYSLLLMMVAQVTGYKPGVFTHTFGDVHIYSNHREQMQLQIQREPRAEPRVILNPNVTDIFDFTYDDITLEGYDPHPVIKGEVAV